MVKKHMFSLEASGNFQTDGFIESTYVDSMRISRGGVSNAATTRTFNLVFYTKLQLTKWWDLQLNNTYSYTYFGFKQGLNTAPVAGSMYNLWASTSFKFWKNMVLEVNGWYNTRGVQCQGVIKALGTLNISVKKSFFKDRFTISISGQNLLESMKWAWTVNNANLYNVGSWQSYNRAVVLGLSYRFGSSTPVERKDKEGNDRLDGGGKGR
jgi:hypothetical protein